MTDRPEGEPLTEHPACPKAAALHAAEYRAIIFGPPERAALALRGVMQYWTITPPVTEEPS